MKHHGNYRELRSHVCLPRGFPLRIMRRALETHLEAGDRRTRTLRGLFEPVCLRLARDLRDNLMVGYGQPIGRDKKTRAGRGLLLGARRQAYEIAAGALVQRRRCARPRKEWK
jgi:hypothetical protein